MENNQILLESKIQPPAAFGNFMSREQLIHRLEAAAEKMVIVSAGMGYGKTVLLTHFAKRYPEKCAWYHLDGTDNDVVAFARYLCYAVSQVQPDFAVDLAPYLSGEIQDGTVYRMAMDFAVAFRSVSREIFLILDDFQTVKSENVLHFLEVLWNNDHGALRLIICTQSAPPAFCARAILRQEVLLLGVDDLALTLEEIKTMVRDYTDPSKLDAIAQALLVHMEGWAAGVSFLALYFRQKQIHMEVEDVEQAHMQVYLNSYIMHELFKKLSPELQKFLTHTSVLKELHPNICNHLLHITDSAAHLAYFEQENLFIFRLSGNGQIYRCHSLFRRFLQNQLAPGVRQQLLAEVSDILLQNHDQVQAVEYAISCGDGGRMVAAMEAAGAPILLDGHYGTFDRWLRELQKRKISLSPPLRLLQAFHEERTGSHSVATAQVEAVLALPVEEVEASCLIGAKLLLAYILRKEHRLEESLIDTAVVLVAFQLDNSLPEELHQQAVKLQIRNLLDLGYADEVEEYFNNWETFFCGKDGAGWAALKEELKMCRNRLRNNGEPFVTAMAEGGMERQKLRVSCFGRFRVFLPNGEEIHWRTRKTQALFAYLFHLGGGGADRERLLDILWGDADITNPNSMLYTSLHYIRKSLAGFGLEQLLINEKKSYRMDMRWITSNREMVDSLDRGGELTAEICAAYEGAYMEDIDGIWAEESRAHYIGIILKNCKEMALRRMEQGDYRGAAEFLRAAVRVEPYDEYPVTLLIRCYAVLGEYRNVVAQYNRLKDTLDKELGVKPSNELTALYRECLLKRLGSKIEE